jgi:hypothetical protein
MSALQGYIVPVINYAEYPAVEKNGVFSKLMSNFSNFTTSLSTMKKRGGFSRKRQLIHGQLF